MSFVEMASVSNDGYITKTVDRPWREVKKGSYTYFRDNDVIVAKITPCMENGKAAFATGLTNGIGMGSSEFHVFRTDETKLLPAFLFYFLNRPSIRIAAEQQMTGSSGHRRVPIAFYEELSIPLLSIEEQQEIISEIASYESAIRDLEQEMKQFANRKKAVLRAYL